ncbi:A disintegrin and metalloproteinase with thrombospondin motifs like [Cotesia typhae]|uniref:A disintegrin and metalloproteinase with thrombospondin motifs like n=1 Tax=Cotesia typhae TaxID=2053667 RepID=UPI003D68B835
MDHAKRHRRSVKGSLDEESDHENYHVIRKIPKLEEIHYSPPIEAFSNSSRTRRSIRYQPVEEYPEIIYPQILLLIDYYILNKFENDWTELIVYVLSFWNGVDMRYRDIIRPRVRLNINGIVIATDPNLLPYLHVGKFGPYAVDIDDALVEKANWLKDEVLSKHIDYFDANDTYDVAVTMTQFTLCGAEPDCGVLGLARPNGACTKYNVAIVKDFGGFGGIMTAAHELGHLFGIHHDGERNRCSDAHDYIMTTFDKFTPQAFDWSPYSLRYTDQFLKSGRGRCLYNHPFYDKPFQRYLPGKLMDANRQCKILRRGYATVIDDSICTQLKCNGIYTDVRLPEAAEGTPCGQGRLCLHGRCDFESLGV